MHRLAWFLVAAIMPLSAQHVVRESIEWLDVWLPDSNSHDLPRVLLIGDSITRGYGKQVEAELKGTAYVGRMATSKSLGDPALLREVALVLQERPFDVIHFNNGMHGEGYSEEEYAAALPELLATIRRYAPRAKLIWASTTEVRVSGSLDQVAPKSERVVKRNALAAKFMARERIPIDDLYGLVKDRPELHVSDGVHFNEKGSAVLAAQVARQIRKLLE